MTDEELERIGEASDMIADHGDKLPSRDRDRIYHALATKSVPALLAEIARLRAIPKQADEGWLADIRQHADWGNTVTPEVIARLLAHIELQDNALHDLLTEAGAMLAYEQGMAEERARIVNWMKGSGVGSADNDQILRTHIINMLEGRTTPAMAELLPPAAARQEADRQRWLAVAYRKALEQIVAGDESGCRRSSLAGVARKALEETAE